MAIDVQNFIIKPQEFGGIYQGANTLERRKLQETQLQQQRQGQVAANTKFLENYLDPKDRLTGTNYDPEIVNGLQSALEEGAALAAKGASTADLVMALGPKINKINEYSTKAKLVNQNIKSQVEKLKGYGGYNIAALEDQAKKMAFENADGTMKDISIVDPSMNWITETIKTSPELVTTGAGLDEFVKKTPAATYSRTAQTSYAGRTKNTKYETTHPFWEDLATDDKGSILTDAAGNPSGLDVVGTTMVGDDGKPMINPETNKPYRVMDKNHFMAIMGHNPDVADYVRGQVNKHFKEAGAEKIPEEGSPQWEMMARSVLGDELRTRSKSSFKTIEQEKQTAPSVKIDIARNPEMLEATKDYYSATRKPPGAGGEGKVTKTTTYADVLSGIMNNEPDYSGGEVVPLGDREVVDITSYVPDLKYANDQVYKKVYRDPQKNSLIVEKQNGEKEEIPESKVFQFMNKLSGYNNLNPEYVSKKMSESGFSGGKFSKAQASNFQAKTQEAQQKRIEERNQKIQTFESNGKISDIKSFVGQKAKDGIIEKIEASGLFTSGKYYIDFKDGSRKTFKSKEQLADYLKSDTQQSGTKPTGGGDWRTRAKKI